MDATWHLWTLMDSENRKNRQMNAMQAMEMDIVIIDDVQNKLNALACHPTLTAEKEHFYCLIDVCCEPICVLRNGQLSIVKWTFASQLKKYRSLIATFFRHYFYLTTIQWDSAIHFLIMNNFYWISWQNWAVIISFGCMSTVNMFDKTFEGINSSIKLSLLGNQKT